MGKPPVYSKTQFPLLCNTFIFQIVTECLPSARHHLGAGATLSLLSWRLYFAGERREAFKARIRAKKKWQVRTQWLGRMSVPSSTRWTLQASVIRWQLPGLNGSEDNGFRGNLIERD